MQNTMNKKGQTIEKNMVSLCINMLIKTKILYENEFILQFHYTIKLAWKFTIKIKYYLFLLTLICLYVPEIFIKYFSFIYFSLFWLVSYQVWIIYYLGRSRTTY